MNRTVTLRDGKFETADIEAARASITLTNNGNLGDNAWLGYRESIPSNTTPIIVPWNCTLVEVSFSNNRTSVDGNLEFYLNGLTVGDIYRTWNFTNVNISQILTGISDTFTAGDALSFQWDDQGQNPRDVAVTLFFILDS